MDSEQVLQQGEKFCKHCGGKIPADAVVCTLCGRQVEEMKRKREEKQKKAELPVPAEEAPKKVVGDQLKELVL